MISSKQRNNNHDAIASIYDLKSQLERHDIVLEFIDKLILQNIPEGAQIFDLGCGTGQVAQRLLKRGYQVTGLDSSERMLNVARENAPDAKFILDDARFFKLTPTFHAAISTDVVLNYILSIDELKNALQNVYNALLENGIFAFELYIEELCELEWQNNESGGGVKDDNVWVDIWSYDTENKIGRKETTIFELVNGLWQRSDRSFFLKPYSVPDVKSVLEQVGFTEISMFELKQDLGVDKGFESACFICRKALNCTSS
ncbi:class I SAM-dependent DNA methyltransferase [Nostoc sp. 'Peltigera membranacea cyanobiont' 210A]|uniref:class I SAM-dependent DNA methyltransferase n=1 Tax=Nostoc sp. 'Peltigera membranacea cyanobiont' 210A TaxID=2014529 RepID=UPI00167DC98F|nr:class I SAM-dependent methyltransferase [Nostoc sp. 'Peltigera membranacea cyanobiont' 210A]